VQTAFDPNLSSQEEMIRYRFSLPASIAFKLETFLADPLRPGKRRYGALNALIQALITNHFAELEAATATATTTVSIPSFEAPNAR
jgi:hypothetical protein